MILFFANIFWRKKKAPRGFGLLEATHANCRTGNEEYRQQRNDDRDNWDPAVDAANGGEVLPVIIALERLQFRNFLLGMLKIEIVCGHSPADPCHKIDVGDAHGDKAQPGPEVHFAI